MLREFIGKEMCSQPAQPDCIISNRHHDVTLAVLYLAVMAKGGDITNGGTSYVHGKWSHFFSKLLESVPTQPLSHFHNIIALAIIGYSLIAGGVEYPAKL